MKILIPTDAFPPLCGGSGWSTFELARGLRARGHDILIVQPMPGTQATLRERFYKDFRIIELGALAPNLPYVRNYFKNERLFPRVTYLVSDLIRREQIDVVHAQHVLTSLPSIEAGRRRHVPVVCTVRDYWPVCYWSDLLHTKEGATLCPACSSEAMTHCIRPRAGSLWPMALPMIPYMQANLARKRSGLAAADALVAVSSTIASDLRARAPELASTRMEIIPNAVDINALRAEAAASKRPLDGPYALYLGKLAPNKGTERLVEIVERAGLDWPLVIAGDGPDRPALAEAAQRSTRDIRMLGWIDREQTVAWLAHASLLIFPSRGPESLSRVLLEASALGVPIAAMNTGGTPDVVRHSETGLLSTTFEGLADDVKWLRADEHVRARLGAAAARWVAQTFDASSVVDRIERLYAELIEGVAGRPRPASAEEPLSSEGDDHDHHH
jgi:glycosyltransferase involved in cell wall biosynthesis